MKIKILIVDDRPENVFALKAAFSDTEYEIYEALSGKIALELSRKHIFACILLDVQMPILDGFETAKAIRNIPQAKHTPIIFVTAIDRTEAYEELGYGAGAVDYLFKPINTKILLAKVRIFAELFIKTEEIKSKNALLEEAMQKSQENEHLKQALKVRDEFLMMAGHEMRTPITPLYLQMQAFIDLFENGKADKVDQAVLLRMLKTSYGQVQRLSKLINELVDVARLTNQKIDLKQTRMNLNTLTKKVLEDFEGEIKKAKCEVKFDEVTSVDGIWDPFRLEQVLVNLITNALKYGSGKPIFIQVGKNEERKAYFSIKDHGIGIAKEDHDRIFQKFERAVSHDSYGGLGIGLFISHQIVQHHKGSIKVESELNQGAKFMVELP